MTWISFILSSFLAGIFVILFYFGRGLPDHSSLENYDPILTNRIYLSDASLNTNTDNAPGIDKVWKDYSKERRFFTPIELVPDLLIKAFLVAEDKNFFIHPGLDLMGVFRACVKNTLTGKWKTRPMGASTITQQVAKNFLLTNERSFTRKVKEAIMAVRIEGTFTKQRILELYLNQIYLGSGCYGVTAAAEYYFHKRLDELNVEEVAFLAGLPKAPEIYQTHKNPDLAKARRNWVLDRLYDEHYITGQALILAKETPIATTTKKKDDNFNGDYFLEATRQKLIEVVGQDNYTKGGYFLWTTVKPDVQRIAHACLQKGLEAYDKRYGYRGPLLTLDEHQMVNTAAVFKTQSIELPPHLLLAIVMESHKDKVILTTQNGEKGTLDLGAMTWARHQDKNRSLGPDIKACSDVLKQGDMIVVRPIKDNTYALEQIPEVTGGIVIMDAETGHVHALSGGYHFAMNQHNAAIQAKRQPGSSFKPFVYLAALERGYSKETKVLDAPLYIPLGFKTKDGKTTYSPKNFSKTYYGPTSLENGLAYSRNVMTVRLAMQIGMMPIASVVKRFGIHDKLPRQLAMALGAGETTLLRLTAAYGMIANGGRKITPTLLTRIDNRDNYPIYTHTAKTMEGHPDLREVVAKTEAIETLKGMLEQVIIKGTGRRHLSPIAQKHTIRILGKTGTTNDCKDAWFVGFVGNLVIGVFVGFPVPRPLGDDETGGKAAAPIAADFLDQYFTLFPLKDIAPCTSMGAVAA